MKNMNMINNTDKVYLTVMSGKRMLASLSVCGVRSLNEIYRHVSEKLHGLRGVITLYLRNSTQGWTQQHTMVLNPKLSPITSNPNSKEMQPTSYPSLFGPDL